MTVGICGEAHPNFTGVVCRMAEGAAHALHIPEGFVIGNVGGPQPWKNTAFVPPASSQQVSVEANALGVTRLFQRALREQGAR